MIPGSFSRKSVKNIKKALGFSLFRAWHSADPQNLIKPVEMMILRGPCTRMGQKKRSSGLGDSQTHPAARPDRCLETCHPAYLLFLPKPFIFA